MKKNIISLLAFLLVFTPFFSAWGAEFNPNYIVSDAELLDTSGMSFVEVQKFLNNKSGSLKNYTVQIDIKDTPFGLMSAAEFIHSYSVKNGINPKFTLVLLQKEQSLITEPNPSQRNLDFATGYGCPDGGSCSARWQGFSKQVNSATLQFKDYVDNPGDYHYQVGNTYTFNDYGKITSVIPVNKATAAFYNYTPHVYNGNYNFWKLWNEWFNFVYPDGSLLQAKSDPVVYLIKNGKKHAFKTRVALATRYSLDMIIQVDQSILDQYILGEQIRHPQYALYRSPKGTVYLLIDDIKHGFASREALRMVGINPEEIENLDQETLAEIPEGTPITIDSVYPMGALLQNESGTIYYVKDGKRYPIVHKDIITVNFGANMPITKVASDEIRKYVAMPPLYLDDGKLVTSDNPEKNAVYVISDGIKRPILSGEAFENLGYKWENIKSVNEYIVEMHPSGDPIQGIN